MLTSCGPQDNLIAVLDARTRFYNDLSEDEAAYWMSRLKTQSRLCVALICEWLTCIHY